MKIKVTAIFFLLIILFNSSSYGGEIFKVKNYFVNGVANTRYQTWESAKKMESEVEVGTVGYLYNSTQNTALDFIEAGIMSLKLDGFYNSDGSVNRDQTELSVLDSYFSSEHRDDNSDLVLYKLGRVYLGSLQGGSVSDFLQDLGIELSSRWSVYGYYLYSRFKNKHGYSYIDYINLKRIHTLIKDAEPIIVAYGNFLNTGSLKGIARAQREYLDLNQMILSLSEDFSNGYRVNLISHSQGNLYAVRLLDYFSRPNSVKHFSVATPADKVYGYSGLAEGGYITLKEDLVSLVFFGALQRNGTNHPQEFWESLVSGIPIQRQIEIYNANKYQFIDQYANVSGDVTGHGFRESYLREGTNSLGFISRRFQENYNQLKYGANSDSVCCDPNEMGFGGAFGAPEEPPANPEEPLSSGLPGTTQGDIYLSRAAISEPIFRKGSRYKISVRQNYSGVESDLENVSLEYFLSKDQYLSGDDLRLGDDRSSIDADDLYDNESLYWDVPFSVETSSYFIIFKADSENKINEDNENNNLEKIAVAIY